MKLAPDYTWRYALVQSVKPGSEEVKLITYKFFKSEQKAWEWLRRKYKGSSSNEISVIPITAFHRLEIYDEDQGVCADHD